MAIKSITEKKAEKLEIDLTGPDGNAFVLFGYAQRLAKQLGYDGNDIVEDMMASDYENLINVFDHYFGDVVTLYR